MGVEMPTRRSPDPSDRQHRFWNGIAWVETGEELPSVISSPVPPRPRLVAPRPSPEPITHVDAAFPAPTAVPTRGADRLPSHRALPSVRRRAVTAAAAVLGTLSAAAAAAAVLAAAGVLPG